MLHCPGLILDPKLSTTSNWITADGGIGVVDDVNPARHTLLSDDVLQFFQAYSSDAQRAYFDGVRQWIQKITKSPLVPVAPFGVVLILVQGSKFY